MQFRIETDNLRYLAGAMADLGEVVASPSLNAIVAYDMMRTRRLSYKPPGKTDPDGQNVGLDAAALKRVSGRVRGEAHVSLTPEWLVIEADCTYRLRLLQSPEYVEEPSASPAGEASMSAGDLRAALEDAQAAGVLTVVIMADKGAVTVRGDGMAGCRISVPDSVSTGMECSRLDNTLLLPCVPATGDCTISLASEGPTVMRFGDVTYHQGARM